MKQLIYIVVLLTACGYDDFGPYGAEVVPAPPPNIEVSALRNRYYGSPLNINEDMVVQGVVTSDDREGNFHRTLVIEDPTGGIEVLVGLYDLHGPYPRGRHITLHLRGLRMTEQDGVLRLGAPPPSWSHYAVDYLGPRPVVERYLLRGEAGPEPVPLECAAGELTTAMCGRLVRVSGLHLVGATPSATEVTGSIAWATPAGAYPAVAGYRRFSDSTGDVLAFTSGYASFAGAQVPVGEVSLTGILGYGPAAGSGGRSMFMLRMRDLNDAQ